MMKAFHRILFMLSSAILLASCDRGVEPDRSFVGGSDIELTVAGRVIYKYNPDTWQLGYNPTTREFRVCDDAMKNYYYVTCSAIPSSKGQKLEATVTWSSGSSTQSMKGKFEVSKAEGDTYWLWCGDKKSPTGVTVRILR